MSLQVPVGGGGGPTQPHHLDSDEICIQETIGKFYIFFQKLVTLKSEIERLGDIDEHTRVRVLDQLDDIESEYCECERVREFLSCICACMGCSILIPVATQGPCIFLGQRCIIIALFDEIVQLLSS